MKILLLDENLPATLSKDFSDHFQVFTVYDMGWQTMKDAELLAAIEESDIQMLLTADRNLEFQQNLESFSFCVVVVLAYTNRYNWLKTKISLIEERILSMDEKVKLFHIELRDIKR